MVVVVVARSSTSGSALLVRMFRPSEAGAEFNLSKVNKTKKKIFLSRIVPNHSC